MVKSVLPAMTQTAIINKPARPAVIYAKAAGLLQSYEFKSVENGKRKKKKAMK